MNAGVDKETIDCFSDQILRDFKAGRLDDPALKAKVSSHLELCLACESRLSTFDDEKAGSTLLVPVPSPKPSVGKADDIFQSSTKSRLNTSDAHATTRKETVEFETLPAKIDRYLVVRELGTGGFAHVFLGKDNERNRLVAIKIPRPDRLPSRESRDAFLNEARAVALMEHPGIAPLYDYRELDDGRCLVVMKFIEGASLKEVMKSRRIPPRSAAKLIARVAQALDYAHRRGVLHRDVKPANILMDHRGLPYLSDFGLAIHTHRQHLHANELAGTYPYMSPEQIQGATDRLDGRSDVWSLGVVLYELLAGRRPFHAATMEQLREEITHKPHPDLLSHDPKIPARLAQICDRCLAKDPRKRYATAGQLAQDLKAYLHRPWKVLAGCGLAGIFALLVWLGTTGGEPEATPRENLEIPQNAIDAKDRAEQAPAVGKHKLVPLAWPTIQRDDFYKVMEPGGQVAVQSTAHFACFETHDPKSEHYKKRISADLKREGDAAGIVLGIHQASKNPVIHRCVLVYVTRIHGLDGMWLEIEEGQVSLDGLRHPKFRGEKRLTPHRVDEEIADRVHLEIEIDSERITSIRYDGLSVENLSTEIKDVNIPNNTRSGVVAMGHVVFHSITRQELAP